MFRRINVFLLVIICCISVVNISAWDDTGHKVTGYIAWQRMTPAVREKVIKVLLAAPEDSDIATFYMPYGSRSMDARKREFFILLTSWGDIVRDRSFDIRYKKYHKSNWHYSDTFWEWKDGKANILESKEETGLALQKLVEFDKLIRSNATDAEKAVAIAWIEHLIGDLHQPLHTSAKVTNSNQKGDQGGNLFFLTPKGTPRAEQKNLHSFWDMIIVGMTPNTNDLCDSAFVDPIAQDIIKRFPYEQIKSELKEGNFEAWTKESFNIAINDVYKDVKWFDMPSEKYRKRAFDISQKRMAMAGYRMGDLFNEAFGTNEPVQTPIAK